MRQEAQMRLQRLEEMVYGLISRAPCSSNSQQDKRVDEPAATKDGVSVLRFPTLASPDPGLRVSGRLHDAVDMNMSSPRAEQAIPIGLELLPSAGPIATMLGQTPFPQATNWAAVLDSIRDIQSYLGEADAGHNNGKHKASNGEVQDKNLDSEMDRDTDEDVDALTTDAGIEEPPTSRHTVNPSQNYVRSEPNRGSVINLGTTHLQKALSTTIMPTTHHARHVESGSPIERDEPDLLLCNSFQVAEPDGILSAITAAPGFKSSNRYLVEAIASLPPRSECDRFMAVYFQASYMAGPFVHTGQFQRSYSHFWRTGNSADANASSPLLWLSMLASILSIGAMMEGRRQLAWTADRNTGLPSQNVDDAHPKSSSAASKKTAEKDQGSELSSGDLAWARRLRKLSTCCLLAGDYLAGRPLAVEALLLNTHVCFMQGRDSNTPQWATFGVVVRLAQRLGYHQVDAPGGARLGIGGRRLTPFEAEMRRRVWYFVESFDLLYSFQFGMPTVVHEDEVATDPPQNLRDDDFDETMQELPPARPPNDYTVALYFAVKLKLIRLLRQVLRVAMWRTDEAKELDKQSYKAVVTRITQELRWSYTTLPAQLRMPMHIRDCPFGDTTPEIMHRLAIEMMHHKSVCILLRQSLSRTASGENGDGCTKKSGFTVAETDMQRQACLVSALRILDLHTEFEYETCPGLETTATGDEIETSLPGGCRGAGRLTADRHMLSPLAMQNFLLAATILCLDLIEENRADKDSNKNHNKSPDDDEAASKTTTAARAGDAISGNRNLGSSLFAPFLGSGGSNLEERAADRSAKIEALRTAYALWHERRLTSREAARAAQILGAIVTKISAEASACGNEDDTTSTTLQPEDESPGWGRWDLSARELRNKQYEDDVRRHRAERAGRASQGVDLREGTQCGAMQPSTARQTHTTSSQNATTGSLTTEAPIQTRQLPAARTPPPHLDFGCEWAEPGPFDALLNDPRNVDWNMVDGFLLDQRLNTEAGGNVWSADLMAHEN
ncbi:hypothetical protein SEPCBS57363_000616 [Sporothrix epigloea]|uniref:Xylanolytic transcriptional activator regulatory domain-containing protein n=1 Tax=Sporothrix epigloea TaxID=1892477 RepID=A0ABP0D8V6_9PEZI